MNKLIVESQNDKYFIERLITKLNLNNLDFYEPLCNINDYICLDGMDNLKKRLQDEKLDDIDRLGIILDVDKEGLSQRLSQINTILKELNIDIQLDIINQFKKDEKLDLEIACYIINIDDEGELEDILKEIKTSDSTYADCLDNWKECLIQNGKDISEKDLLKFWINNYIRFDTCSNDDKKQISKKCNLKVALEKDIWDFDHKVLDDLKVFLKLFGADND